MMGVSARCVTDGVLFDAAETTAPKRKAVSENWAARRAAKK